MRFPCTILELVEECVEVEQLARNVALGEVLAGVAEHGSEGERAMPPAGQLDATLAVLSRYLFDHPALGQVADRPPVVGAVLSHMALEFGEWDPDVPLCPRLPESEQCEALRPPDPPAHSQSAPPPACDGGVV